MQGFAESYRERQSRISTTVNNIDGIPFSPAVELILTPYSDPEAEVPGVLAEAGQLLVMKALEEIGAREVAASSGKPGATIRKLADQIVDDKPTKFTDGTFIAPRFSNGVQIPFALSFYRLPDPEHSSDKKI